ncbi:MAG TPA: hypothetical protein VIF14_04660 [Alphaproteobacteria bacterium]|jgi:hypothetical protein
MARPSSIKILVVIAALSMTGGFVGADALFGDGLQGAGLAGAWSAHTVTVPLPPADDGAIRDTRYGFRFQAPPGWTAGPRNDASVVASVGRADGVYCYVRVLERKLSTEPSGRPHNLEALLAALTPSQVAGAFSSVPMKVESFATSSWGGQEARNFVISAAVPIAGTLKLEGQATLRRNGTVVLTCVAPARQHGDADVRAAFAKVRNSFVFEQP